MPSNNTHTKNTEEKKFNFVLVQYSRDNVELAGEINTYALDEFECDGIEEFALEEARVDEILGERAYSGGDIPESLIDEVQEATLNQDSLTYKYFFYQNNFESNAKSFATFMRSSFPGLPVYEAQKNFEDWNAEWKKFYTPIIVSSRLEIIPEWLRFTRENSTAEKVLIYPGMGFGTGTHETTYLCLCLFDKIMDQLSEKSPCLDFGCGSGILGIAALKMKQMPTVFCDIDKSALDNCVQNIVLNFEGESLEGTQLVIRDRFNAGPKYKLVFANILEHVLLLEKNVIINSIEKDGYLIVSGLLNHQVDNIVKNYPLKKVEVLSKNDWSAILFQAE